MNNELLIWWNGFLTLLNLLLAAIFIRLIWAHDIDGLACVGIFLLVSIVFWLATLMDIL